MPNKEISIGVNLDFAACRALVKMGIDNMDVLMTPEEARTFGAKLMGASHEAEVQGFLIDWITKQVGPLDTEQGTAIAMQFRQYCAKRHPPKPGPGGDRGIN
jgi:hypothetical protein